MASADRLLEDLPFSWHGAREGARGERAHYNEFYAAGGWQYSAFAERCFLRDRLIRPLGLEAGGRLLEIGCGMGLHAALWQELGFRVTATDISNVGIQHARARNPGPHYVVGDLEDLDFGAEQFDVVFCRGMTWYHYELLGKNRDGVDVPARTADLFRSLTEGGLFILQICTDFSGHGRGQGGVHYNTLDDYVALFSRFGAIELLTNWHGQPLRNQAEALRRGGNVIVATRRRAR